MCDTCGDNRFELIEKYKQKLIESTNISDSPEEMAVIDNILFRFWQMGWLKGELFGNSEQLDCSDCVNHGGDWDCDHVHCHIGTGTITDSISRTAVIDELEERLRANGYSNVRLVSELNRCIGYIMRLPSAQQWIPWDSGKLPKESGYYTVTAYDGATKRVTYAKYQKRLKRWELTGARAYWRVLAWLPPLEPWKGDKHEAE